jgi:hypothetical protein
MANFLSSITTYIRDYFSQQQERRKEKLLETVQSTEPEKHISGTKNLLMRYEPKQKPKISNTPPPPKK